MSYSNRAMTFSAVFALFCCVILLPSMLQAQSGSVHYYELDTTAENHLITSIGSTDVAPIIGANTFHNAGYTGQNTITSNIEAGHVWSGHDTLGHVTVFDNAVSAPGAPFGTPAYDRHATWVGSMIGGRRVGAGTTEQEGIAYNTDLRSGAIATGWSGSSYALSFGISFASLDTPYDSATVGFGTADVINSSWGGTDTSGTGTISLLIDSLSKESPTTTMVASAGNSGGSNTVGSPGSGYNGITVGALQNDGSNNYSSVASFSSRGPQDYADATNGTIPNARAAVDIAAPGTNLRGAYYGGQTGGNDASLAGSTNNTATGDYGTVQGTSFAAPIVASGVSLMKSAAKGEGLPATALDTRVVKASLLNAADKISGWTNNQSNVGGVITTTQALDNNSGAGAMNLTTTYNQYLQGQTDITGVTGGTSTEAVGWDFAEVAFNGTTDIVLSNTFEGGTTFTTTLTWFRDRTYVRGVSLNDNAYADLSLEVWDDTFTTKFAESISDYNPVEHLSFLLPTDSALGLRIAFDQTAFGTLSSEEFGVAWSGQLIPEPASAAILVIGIVAVVGRRHRRAA